jgi:CrcB protein
MGRILLLVGIGGSIGSLLRYLVSLWLSKAFPASSIPYGTFAVNIAGCFLIGCIYELFEKQDWMTTEWRFFLATGFCGGFTTFSSFAFENYSMINEGNWGAFIFYSAASFILGLAAVYVGINLIKIF